MNTDPLADLATIIAAAAAGTVDPHALREVCLRVIHGGQAMKERLGCLVAHATLTALETSTVRPHDPRTAAEQAFTVPKDAQA